MCITGSEPKCSGFGSDIIKIGKLLGCKISLSFVDGMIMDEEGDLLHGYTVHEIGGDEEREELKLFTKN